MATETIASDHTSTTDEQYVKQEKDEGIAEKIISLANEDEDKHDKPEDAQGQATPLSKTEGDEVKAELAAAEIEKSDDSPALNTSAEDTQTPGGEKEGDDKKAEPAVAEEETDDSVPLEENVVAVADDLKEEKELVPDSQTISVAESVHDAAKCQQDEPPSTEPAVKETPQQLEKESIETKQPKTADIPEAETIEKSVENIEKSSNAAETIALTESEAEVVKQAEILDTSAQKEEKPEPNHVATEVQEKTGKPEKESQEKTEETEQPSSVAIAEPSAETNDKESNAIEGKTTAEILKETNNHEVEPTETGKAEPVVTEVEPTKTGKEEPVVTEVEPTETVVTEVEPTETGKAEPVVTEVEENQKEPEKQSTEQKEEEQSITFVIPEHTTETSDVIAVEEKTREPELEAEVLKETNNYEAGPTETEKAEPVITEVVENQIEPEKQSFKQEEPKTVTPETAAEIQEQPGDTFEFHPPKNSDTEVVKDTSKSELEAILVKEEKPELLSTEVEEKPIEQLQVVAGEDEKTSKGVEIKQETDRSEGSLTIKDPKEEKTEKEEETNTMVDTAQVSLNEEARADPANAVEPSPKVEEKVVGEDVASKEVAGVTENPEQASIDQEAKAGLKEESEHCVPTGVEEKVVVAAKDDKKEPEAPDAVQVTSREAEVEIKKTDEENEAKTATTEVGSVKVESLKNDIPAVDDKKEGDTDTKVDEISKAVSEPVRETLASKFEEKEEETIETGVNNLEKEQIEEPVKTEVEATKESDANKTSKDLPKETPAKPAQKQSNNIISKVKQSLVKAKKAITGKSPSSKNLSSDAKGDIKVK